MKKQTCIILSIAIFARTFFMTDSLPCIGDSDPDRTCVWPDECGIDGNCPPRSICNYGNCTTGSECCSGACAVPVYGTRERCCEDYGGACKHHYDCCGTGACCDFGPSSEPIGKCGVNWGGVACVSNL